VNVFEPRLPVLPTVVMSLRTVWALLYVDRVRYARIGSVSRLMVPSRRRLEAGGVEGAHGRSLLVHGGP
jgi:hypothetical protein